MNNGSTIVFYVGYYSHDFPRRRTYLYFDVSSSLPLDAVVTSAYLKLHQNSFIGTGSLQIGLYPVTGGWEENVITWNNQPVYRKPNIRLMCPVVQISGEPGISSIW
jgi:hypothetical protein